MSSQHLEETAKWGEAGAGRRWHLPHWLSFLGLPLVTVCSSHLSWPLPCIHPLRSVSNSTAWSCAFPSSLSKSMVKFLRFLTDLFKVSAPFSWLTLPMNLHYCLEQLACSSCGPFYHIQPHSDPQNDDEKLTGRNSYFLPCLHVHLPLPIEGKIRFPLFGTSCSYYMWIGLGSQPNSFLTNYHRHSPFLHCIVLGQTLV